jgi:steroid delta-isomerase-like uncharacterized protein
MATETTQPEQLVHDYAAWLNGESSKVKVLSESVDVYNPGLPDGEVHSRSDYQAYIQGLRTGLPDFQFTADEVISSGDTVMVEFSITGTHDGELKGIPATGRKIEIRGIEKFRVADGKIQAMYAYFDTRQIPEQLGLTFPTVLSQLPKLALKKIR